MKVREVLVHKPGLEVKLIDKPKKWSFTDYPNLGLMQKEHDKLVETLKNEGVKVHYLMKTIKSKPKLYLIRDNAIVIDRKAVTSHFYHSTRRGEEQLVKKRLRELGIKIAGHIFVPGFLEASDIFFVNKSYAFAFIGERTNMKGIEHLMKVMDVEVVPIKGGFSNKKLNFLDNTVVVSEEFVDQPVYDILKEYCFDIVIARREEAGEFGLNFIQVDDYKVINIESGINKKLKMIGFDVIEVEIQELMKGNAGIRNMFLPFY